MLKLQLELVCKWIDRVCEEGGKVLVCCEVMGACEECDHYGASLCIFKSSLLHALWNLGHHLGESLRFSAAHIWTVQVDTWDADLQGPEHLGGKA